LFFRPFIFAAAALLAPLMQIHAGTAVALGVTQFTTSNDSVVIDVATDFHNNAVAVYDDTDIIFAVFSADGGLWGPPVTLSDFLVVAANPAVAMDESGTALAAWVTFESPNTVETAFFSNGTWSTPNPNPLDSSFLETFGDIALAMNGSGKGLAAWSDSSNDGFASFFSNGTWSSPTTIASGIVGLSGIQSAFSPSGKAAVMFADLGTIGAVNFDGIGWRPPVILDLQAESFPSLGIDANGNAIGVWVSNGATFDIVASRFDGTSWSTPQIISNGVNNSPPKIAVAPDGTAVAVWVDGALNVQMSQFNGTSWSVPILIAPNAQPSFATADVSVAVTMDDVGNALIVWPSSNQQLMGVLLPKRGVLGTPFVITTEPRSEFFGSINAALSNPSLGWAVWNENQIEGGNTFGTSILLSPPTPTNVTATVCVNKFATQTDRINVITFTPSSDPTASYQITRDGVLIAIIPPTGPFTFFDHNRCKGVTYTYTITAISPLGGPSTPVTITIKG
jgi:hypothetical protein